MRKQGYTYIEYATEHNISLRVAIERLNELVKTTPMVFGGYRNGYAFWVPDTTEPAPSESSKTRRYICVVCRHHFRTSKDKQKFCSPQCRERFFAAACAHCGKVFIRKVLKQKFCNKSCMAMARTNLGLKQGMTKTKWWERPND